MTSRIDLDLPCPVDWTAHAIFLDFDGTLAPIVDQPEDAAMAATTAAALFRLATLTEGAIAIVTGRALSDIDRLLPAMPIAISGSHGLEFRMADGTTGQDRTESAALTAAGEPIAAFASDHGLLVENKPGAVTLHYRSRPDLADGARALVDGVAGTPGLRALHGKMVSEVVLAGIDKGSALQRFLADLPFAGRIPIAAGDDVTDEDAFRAAQAVGGVGIKIGTGETAARIQVRDIEIFLDWLGCVSGLPDNN